jgi:hypothetical protein
MQNLTARLLALGLLFAATGAQALTIDAKAMARFDLSYTKCEAQIPEMKGHRDAAYLSLWRTRADDKTRAQLAAVRKGAAYQAEQRRVKEATAKGAMPPASSPLDQQCQALWAETQKGLKAKS